MQALTTFDSEPYEPPPSAEAMLGVEPGEGGSAAITGHPVNWLVLMILALVGLGLLHANSKHLQSSAFGISFYTVAVILLIATVGQKVMQVFVAKYPVPGLTQIFHS